MKTKIHSHARAIGFLCSLGLFLAGYIFYSSSLIESYYAAEFTLTSWQIGIAQSAVPLGAIIGAVLAGRLADIMGRQRLLAWNFILLACVGESGALVFNYSSLCLVRLINGLLAGTLYPLCAAYLTEMTPQASLARQSAILMFINCMAAPLGCIVAFALSCFCSDHVLWRLLSAAHVVPALIAYVWSLQLPESSEWMANEKVLTNKSEKSKTTFEHVTSGVKILFTKPYCNLTLCLMGAWFLMDVAYYGINFFVPYLLQAIQIKTISTDFNSQTHSLLTNETMWGTLIINIFFLVGALSAVFIVERINLIKLQKYGFLLASISLFLLAGYFYVGLKQSYVIILLFVLFNFAINIGPDVTTYLLSATAYPVEIRGSGHGFNAGFAKFGSFLGVLFLPRLQDLCGFEFVILLLAVLLFTAYLLSNMLTNVLQDEHTGVQGNIAYETN